MAEMVARGFCWKSSAAGEVVGGVAGLPGAEEGGEALGAALLHARRVEPGRDFRQSLGDDFLCAGGDLRRLYQGEFRELRGAPGGYRATDPIWHRLRGCVGLPGSALADGHDRWGADGGQDGAR